MTAADRDWVIAHLRKVHDIAKTAETRAKAKAAELMPSAGDDPMGMRMACELGTLRGVVDAIGDDIAVAIRFLTPLPRRRPRK